MNNHSLRELWLTPATQHFLHRWAHMADAKCLNEYIVRALDGRQANDGTTMLTGLGFLIRITEPEHPMGYERVVVWHPPTDGGIHFREALLETALPFGVDFN